jgi:hypothetical protein
MNKTKLVFADTARSTLSPTTLHSEITFKVEDCGLKVCMEKTPKNKRQGYF